MNIRTATPADLSDLAELFDQYRIFYKKNSDLPGARAFLEARLTRQESVVFVADSGEGLLGFVQLYPLFSSTRMRRLWLLNDLFVQPSARGQGLSVQLIEACKTHCRETDGCGLMLETAQSNVIGNALYPRVGFELDTEHNYYSWDC
jgi:ribosomal protein S18 acetylase RimI-like enzyme